MADTETFCEQRSLRQQSLVNVRCVGAADDIIVSHVLKHDHENVIVRMLSEGEIRFALLVVRAERSWPCSEEVAGDKEGDSRSSVLRIKCD